jgi:hypothetical protein
MQHWVNKTQGEDKQNTITQHKKTKKMSNEDPKFYWIFQDCFIDIVPIFLYTSAFS